MFLLNPKPTFKYDVVINSPFGEGKIKIEFKHKGRKALKELFDSLTDAESPRSDIDLIVEIAAGWEGVDEKFSRASLETLLDNYPGAASAIFAAYNQAMFEVQEKN